MNVDEARIKSINKLADKLISQGVTDTSVIKDKKDYLNTRYWHILSVVCLSLYSNISSRYQRRFDLFPLLATRWNRIQGALDDHRQNLAAALEIHAFDRDVDDINERINEKVRIV